MLLALNLAIALYLVAPVLVVIATAFTTTAYPVFPPEGFTFHWFKALLTTYDFLSGARVSLLIGVVATGIATVLGVTAALGLNRGGFRRSLERSTLFLFLSPIFFPPIVLGLALLIYFHTMQLVGTLWGMIIGHVVLITPFVMRLTATSLSEFDLSVEEAAQNLGAGRLRVFLTVTLPLIRPGIIAGAIFAFLISFDELVVTLFLAGPGLQTLPIRIFTFLQYSSTPAISAVATVILILWMVLGIPVYARFFDVGHNR